MKFQKRKVENDDLIKPLLSQMKAEASCSKPTSPVMKPEGYKSANDEYVRMTGLAMLKMSVVVAVTTASVAFYAISFTDMFVADTAVSSLSIIGAAGGISLLLAPWVCVKELRLARYPSKLITLQTLQHIFMLSNSSCPIELFKV
jgi:hypothetical protein